ncbi:retrovirus-related pol polyprotein from transposon TNT 1-94, partial [Tanacetum coccineum]
VCGKDAREIFGMSIPDALFTNEIKGAPYYSDYQEHVAKYQQILDAERGKAEEGGATESFKATKVTKPKAAKVTKPTGDPDPKKRKLVKETPDEPLPAKILKAGLVGKRCKSKSPLRLIDEPSDEGVPVEEPAHDDEEANLQRVLELSLKEQGERTQGPARPVVLREPDSEKFQPLPEVQGKGKKKVVEEQAAHDLLTLQTPMKKSPTEQFIFQRRPPMPTESSAHVESPSMDAELNLTDSETESDEEASKINARNQEEGQARPNPGVQDEGQAGPNPGIAAETQLQSSHVVHARPNLKHMDLGTSDASTQQKPEQMDEEFTTTAYPNVQENLKLLTEDQVILEEPASSTRTLSSLQNLDKDLSFTDQFFLEKTQEEEPWKTNAEAERIGELEQHMVDLIQNNLALEERLDKQGSRIYNLENLNIPHKVSQAIDEIVTDAVDWAMQAPLRARFTDLPTEEARKKRRKRRDVPRTPPGSPPSQPPPPPPLAGMSGAPCTSRVSGSSQFLPPPPPPSTGTSRSAQEQGNKAPKERPTTPEPAWTIPSSNKSDVANNWASVLATTYEPPAENSLLANIGDMTTFLKWYFCHVNKATLTQACFKGQAYEVIKAFYPDVIHLQFQMEECHKMLTSQVD